MSSLTLPGGSPPCSPRALRRTSCFLLLESPAHPLPALHPKPPLTLQADTTGTQPSVPRSHSTYRPYLLPRSCFLQTSAVRSVFHKPHMTGQTEMQAAETPEREPVGAGLLQPHENHLGAVGPSQHPARCCPMWIALREGVPGAGAGHGAQSSLAPSKRSSQHRACVEARDANLGTRSHTPGLGWAPPL